MRELENVIERAMILHRGEPLRFDDLGFPTSGGTGAGPQAGEEALPLDAFVRQHIKRALEMAGGKIHGRGGAGQLLGVSPNTLRYKMQKSGIPCRKQAGEGWPPAAFPAGGDLNPACILIEVVRCKDNTRAQACSGGR